MARIDATGAEVGSIIEVDSTTATALVGTFSSSLDVARSGLRSWKAQIAGSTLATDSAFGSLTVAGAPTAFTVSFGLYVPSAGLPSGNPAVLQIRFLTDTLRLVVSRQLGLLDLDLNPSGAAVTGLAFDQWHHVRVRVAITGGTDTVTLHVGDQTSTDSIAVSNNGVTAVEFGIVEASTAVNATVYIDDLILDNTNADTGYDHQLAFMRPTSTDSAGLTLVGAATHHAAVTDNSDTSTVGYAASTANIVNIYSANNPTPALPPSGALAVKTVFGSVRNGGAADSLTGTSHVFLWIVGGVNSTFARPAPATSATTRRSTLVSATRPAGGAWLASDLAIIKPTVGKETSGLPETFTFQEVWLYAEVRIDVTVTDTATVTETAAPVVYSEGLGGGGFISIVNE